MNRWNTTHSYCFSKIVKHVVSHIIFTLCARNVCLQHSLTICVFLQNFVAIGLTVWELLQVFDSQYGGLRHLGFSKYANFHLPRGLQSHHVANHTFNKGIIQIGPLVSVRWHLTSWYTLEVDILSTWCKDTDVLSWQGLYRPWNVVQFHRSEFQSWKVLEKV